MPRSIMIILLATLLLCVVPVNGATCKASCLFGSCEASTGAGGGSVDCHCQFGRAKCTGDGKSIAVGFADTSDLVSIAWKTDEPRITIAQPTTTETERMEGVRAVLAAFASTQARTAASSLGAIRTAIQNKHEAQYVQAAQQYETALRQLPLPERRALSSYLQLCPNVQRHPTPQIRGPRGLTETDRVV